MLPLRKPIFLYGAIIFILALGYYLPIKLPLSISITGKVYPIQEWLITNGPNGEIISKLVDNKSGLTDEYSVIQFERGDAAGFKIHPEILTQDQIKAGQPVATITSNYWTLQIVELEGLLAQARANYNLLKAPEADAIVTEARAKLEYARVQLEEQYKIVDRLEKLVAKGLGTQEFLDIERSKQNLYRVNISIAEAGLAIVTEGANAEQLELVNQEINALEQQLNHLSVRNNQQTISTPIDGIKLVPSGTDTLIQIYNPALQVIMIPVHPDDLAYIRTGQTVELKHVNGPLVPAKIIQIDGQIHQIGGRNLVLVKALTDQSQPGLLPGMGMKGDINCSPVMLRTHLNRFFAIR